MIQPCVLVLSRPVLALHDTAQPWASERIEVAEEKFPLLELREEDREFGVLVTFGTTRNGGIVVVKAHELGVAQRGVRASKGMSLHTNEHVRKRACAVAIDESERLTVE